MSPIKKKKVLFIGPRFHDYEKRIAEEISTLNLNVNYFSDFSDDKIFQAFKATNLFFFLKTYIKYKLKNKLKEIENKGPYDFVFVIRGEGIPKYFWIELKEKYNKNACKFIMYQWDSISNYNYLPFLEYFEDVYTFDSKDSNYLKFKHNNSKYLALFYDENAVQNNNNLVYLYDFAFIGGATVNRYEWLKIIKSYKVISKYKVYVYMYLPFITFFFSLLKGKYFSLKSISFFSMSLEEISEIYQKTKVIIDLPHPDQSGLTMRTLEVIGGGNKLITSNLSISKEPFYHPNNILIINFKDYNWVSSVDSFISMPYVEIDIQQYSLRNWINIIFNNNEN
jgi:hypothetical protein